MGQEVAAMEYFRTYLDDRWVSYASREGGGYDAVLRCPLASDTYMVCYVEDTLILAA